MNNSKPLTFGATVVEESSKRSIPRYEDQPGKVWVPGDVHFADHGNLDRARCRECGEPSGKHKLICPLRDFESNIKQALEPGQPAMRAFETGATRSSDAGKLDYEGCLSPAVLEAFAAYMDVNRIQLDGKSRASDNWQKGMPADVWMKSGLRHIFDMWKASRGIDIAEGELAAACGVLFNVMGWVLGRIKADSEWLPRELAKYKLYRAAELESRR